MKKIFLIGLCIFALVLAGTYSFAQMRGKQSPMGGQMMSQEMMQDMSMMMNHMIEMMQKMSHSMSHRTVTEHMKMNEMAEVMKDMSAMMDELAGHMEKGTMDIETVKKMQERINVMKKMMEGMEKEGK